MKQQDVSQLYPKTSVGLCLDCQHTRIIENQYRSVFLMCERSKTDTQFAKYPHLPMIACKGYEKK